MNMRNLAVATGLLVGWAATAWAGGDLWMTDFEAAKVKAAEQNKYLLVDFTGSDWCIWCKRLNAEVFSTEHFQAEAPKQFILVEIDFPRDKSNLTAEQQQANEKLAKKYGIRGFPTVLLMDAQGRVFARTGYQRGGGQAYMEHLNKLVSGHKKFEELLAKAEKAQGADKARLLDQALESQGPRAFNDYPELVDQVIALDADNALGLKNKYACRRAMAKLDEMPQDTPPARRIARIDEIIKQYQPTGTDLQQLLFFKGIMTVMGGDPAGAQEILEKAVQADPKSDLVGRIQRIQQVIRQRLEAQQKQQNQGQSDTAPAQGGDEPAGKQN